MPIAFARFQHDDFAAARRERARDRESDHARADHYAFDLVHVFSVAGSSSAFYVLDYCVLHNNAHIELHRFPQ